MAERQKTILCLASYEKGKEFMRECKRQGARVLLLTSQSLQDIDWPRESLDDIFFMPDVNKEWNMKDVIYGVSYLSRREQLDRVVALDDFDVEKAAAIREHIRVTGMGDTTARYFRDKLAMRVKAIDAGIPVPPFAHILNYDALNEFLNNTEPPYVIKPRMQAGAIGIKKVHSRQEFWDTIHQLGDEQSFYLVEKFIPGNVYHIDSIVCNYKIKMSLPSKYHTPPMEVAHQGRVFATRTLQSNDPDIPGLMELNNTIITQLGLKHGISHTEVIRAEDGTLYFLETSARAGGAHIVELVEAATGVNLWAEWAKIELMDNPGEYQLPEMKRKDAALMISLAKQEYPDLSGFSDPEVVWKIHKPYHAGLIVASPDYHRITQLLDSYLQRFYSEFFTSQPLPDKPSD